MSTRDAFLCAAVTLTWSHDFSSSQNPYSSIDKLSGGSDWNQSTQRLGYAQRRYASALELLDVTKSMEGGCGGGTESRNARCGHVLKRQTMARVGNRSGREDLWLPRAMPI